MSYYVHSIQTDFTTRAAPPCTRSSSHTNLLLNLGNLMRPNTKSSTGQGHADWRSSRIQPSYSRRTRGRALVSSSFSSRSAAECAPPRISCAYVKFDSFSAQLAADLDPFAPPPRSPTTATGHSVLYRTPRAGTTAPVTLSAPKSKSQGQPSFHIMSVAQDRDARSRVVAGMLLNRVHVAGKPMRRRSFGAGPKVYVKSGLSNVISMDA
ncbi:hypothetical protein C0991_000662 [Blastosporella zonata]|nr:hypothetical protein C0991_000662 [Blastosporella zonata]